MTLTNLVLFGIIELLMFFIILSMLIIANKKVKALKQEIFELQLTLPPAIKETKESLSTINSELNEYCEKTNFSPEKIGYIAGEILTEILLLNFKTTPVGKEFIVITKIIKAFNINKLLKPLLLLKKVR